MVIPFVSLPDRIPITTLDNIQLFATLRADRRQLFYNRAEQAFLEGIEFDFEEPLPFAGQTPPRDLSVNVFLQYIGGLPPERVMSFDLDSLYRIVEAIFLIIYPALGRRTLPPNKITAEMVADAARFNNSDPTGVLRPEPPRSAPPSVAPVTSSTPPDAYWIVEMLAEASLLASHDPVFAVQRESSRAGRESASGAPSPLPPPAELLRAFHVFMLTLTGTSTKATLSDTIAAARAFQKPSPEPPAEETSREARSQAPLAAVAPPPAAPSAPPGAQTAPNAIVPEQMASDAGTTDAPLE